MDLNYTIQIITVYAVPFIFAITLHEASHAYAARHFGDATAYMLGRMTLNPVKHIDPIWTILVPLVLLWIKAPIVIGAAKPVPVNFAGLRNPKRDSIWVAAAGPMANLVMMIGWGVLAAIVAGADSSPPSIFLKSVAVAGIQVNALVMIFNLLPILPLDGGRIVAGLLPDKLSYSYSRLEPYGMFILIGLLLSGLINPWLWPLVAAAQNAIYFVFGL